MLAFTRLPAQSFQASGKVTDKSTGLPLAGASVFCQQTTIGTVTGTDGDFSLNLANGGYELVVSFNGYETFSIRINSGTDHIGNLDISLKQKEKSLETVSVTVSNEVADGWDKYGVFFREQFIGQTENSALCKIENPEVLRFFYNKKKNRLKVTAREELRVTNRALGYSIRYQLDSFVHEYASGLTQYTGFPFFEVLQGSAEDSVSWAANREKAYFGSQLHFMRSYYDSTLADNSFKIELVKDGSARGNMVKNPYDSLYFSYNGSSEVELRFPGKLRVVYAEEKPEREYLVKNKLALNTTVQISLLEFTEAIIIEENGYFYDQKDLLSLGYWSWEKLADFLPYNYEPATY